MGTEVMQELLLVFLQALGARGWSRPWLYRPPNVEVARALMPAELMGFTLVFRF